MTRYPKIVTINGPQDVARAVDHIRNGWKEALHFGQPMVVDIGLETKNRNRAQNKLYWAVLGRLSERFQPEGNQYSKDAWHFFLRSRILGMEDLPFGGQKPISTASLTQTEFVHYMEQVFAFAAEYGIDLAEHA